MAITLKHTWYHKVNVPCSPTNAKYGLEDIKVYGISALQKSYGMVANIVVYLNSGSIRLTVAESKNNPGTLYLITPGQERIIDENGEAKYYENVQLRYELKAQILKYVEKFTVQV